MPKGKYVIVSDIIKRLKDLQEEHGNLPVRVMLPGAVRKPLISGIRYCDQGVKDTRPETIDIIPKYDVLGLVNEMSGCNSVVYQMSNIQTLFIRFATDIVKVKGVLEELNKKDVTVTRNGQHLNVVSLVKDEFKRLYVVAQSIQAGIKSIQGFDKRISQVVQEPFKDSDYGAMYSHHLDFAMSDAEFAKSISEGIGEKTSTQRMAVYLDIIDKINEEIENRKRRLAQLKSRMAKENNSNEGVAAKILHGKIEGIIETLKKRRAYIKDRFDSLRSSVLENIERMTEKAEDTTSN